ncbi:putative reverse transcriptase domain-containing protein [Tanacetum coccineum]
MTIECVTYGVFTLQESVERATKALARTHMSLLKAIKRQKLIVLDFDYDREGLGVYFAGDVLNYAFLASRLQSAGLQTKLLRHTGIVSPGPNFDDALSVFNISMETDLLSSPSEIVAPKLMKKMADIYFTRVTKNAESTCSLSPRQMALWISQREDHTFDWLRTVHISRLGQTMNGKTYRCVLCYRLGILLFSVSKPCSRVFARDIYGDHVVSCVGVIGIKHRHNVVRDTLVDICYRSGISAGKEVDIGLDGGRDKPLRPADMLLYSWDGGLDVCVDLTGSSPLTQTGMVDFVPGQAVIDATQRKRDKYMAKCTAIGYGFLPFSFSSLGELEADAVTLLKRIRKFSMAQDIGARAAVHIFNRISFAIAKGMLNRSHDAEDHREDIDIQEMLNRGKNWSVTLGRRDGVTTNLKAANMYMSSPFEPVANITVKFTTIGLDIKDFVALSGAHTTFTYVKMFKSSKPAGKVYVGMKSSTKLKLMCMETPKSGRVVRIINNRLKNEMTNDCEDDDDDDENFGEGSRKKKV